MSEFNITYLINEPTFALFNTEKFLILGVRVPPIQTEKGPLNLQGIGHTATDGKESWLLTLNNTRTSYIFYPGEQISPTYVGERLHYYDTRNVNELANAVFKFLSDRASGAKPEAMAQAQSTENKGMVRP